MTIRQILRNIEKVAKLEDGKHIMKTITKLSKEMEKIGIEAMNAVAQLLDHHDPDIIAAATFVLGTEWSIANYDKMMEISRRFEDNLVLQEILLIPVIASFDVTGAPALQAFLEEFKDQSEEHKELLTKLVFQHQQLVEQYRFLRQQNGGMVQ